MSTVKRLPLGLTDFANLIDTNLLYVDKTDLVAEIAKVQGTFFLSRPRSFGKSILVSTFKELFSHGTERFKGLKLEHSGWKDHLYPVVHLDFSMIPDYPADRITFNQAFAAFLRRAFKRAGIKFKENGSWIYDLGSTLDRLPNRSLVLLIDEYDAPLAHTLDQPEEFAARQNLLDAFFAVIKSNNSKFRFAFVTGLASLSNFNFTSFNNVIDLSFDPQFGEVAGITQQELEDNFQDYIENAAAVLNKAKPEIKWDKNAVLRKLKEHYGGYSFDEDAYGQVYNPGSILKFMLMPYMAFKNYWLDGGACTPSLLVKSIKKLKDSGQGLGDLADFLNPGYVRESDTDCLSSLFGNTMDKCDLFALLYQTGSLSIKSANAADGTLMVGIPNSEAERAFCQVIVKELTKGKTPDSSAFI